MLGSTLGAVPLDGGRCLFRVWAPKADRVAVNLTSPSSRAIPMARGEHGYHEAVADDVEAGARYYFVLDGEVERPDPASRFQPEGVHGPSEVVGTGFAWTDSGWRNLPFKDYVLYELHIGTFTPEGTFESAIPRLRDLHDIGVTAIEMMPVAQFPGGRNWGYDGVYPFAAQNSYGGPEGLKRLVNACHETGIAVVMDVVYNHLGPEGNYLRDFGPYFTDRYHTPWGDAINFDGPGSDEVKRFFLESAVEWAREYHIDGFRLDAIDKIFDHSAKPFLQEFGEVVRDVGDRLGKPVYTIAESDLNDPRIVRPVSMGGVGMDAQWNDSVHHALHVAVTGERQGYYLDFTGAPDIAQAINHGFTYTGQYSEYRDRRFGAPADDVPLSSFVVYTKNHDQIGNRMIGDRLTAIAAPEANRLAAALALLSPTIPMIFMGQEYGETAPFPYFVSHSDADLIEAVREGREHEFAAFGWEGEPPDPQDEATFETAKLHHRRKAESPHRETMAYYRELIRLRKHHPALVGCGKGQAEAETHGNAVLVLKRQNWPHRALLAYNFADAASTATIPVAEGEWELVICSSDEQWAGHGDRRSRSFSSKGELKLELEPWEFVFLSRP
ncbi:MAG: malto-oligosyltrehalose trehalohydrolase [Chloroflexota bacterium]